MRVGTSSFRGEVPLLTPRGLPDAAAQVAVNARLDTGDLEAFRRPLHIKALAHTGAPVKTIFLLGDKWLSWQQEVEVARGIIPGDDTKRTYITGLDVPRWTNYSMATTGAEPFPVETRPIGVPAPETPPTLDVQPPAVVTGDVPLQNPGAESGVLEWTATAGGLADHDNSTVPGFQAYAGTHYWSGGPNASTIAHQDIDLVLEGITSGQAIELVWHQASGANGGRAGLAIYFLDIDGDQLAVVDTDVMAITPALTWTERKLAATVPDDAVKLRILQAYTRVGGTDLDAYVDAIVLNKQQFSLSWDGSSLSGWTLSQNGGPSSNRSMWLSVDANVGTPQPSILMDMDSRVPFMWQDLGTDLSPACVLKYDVMWNERSMVSLFANKLGSRAAFVLSTDKGIVLEQYTAWDQRGSGNTIEILDAAVKPVAQWLTVTLSAVISSPSKARVTCKVVSKGSGTVYLNDKTIDWPIDGGVLAFTAFANERSRKTWYDNLALQITPKDSPADETTLYTAYVYTFVNDLGEESAPSDPSETVQRNVNSSVAVTTPTTVPPGMEIYEITAKRIYRAATGSTGTVFRFVEEIPLSQAVFVDNLPDSELGEPLESDNWELPPDDLRNILALPNGIMVGSSGNELCFSVAGHPHAWPVAYRLPVDTDIVGLGNVDTTVFLGTQSFVYTASGNAPDSYSMSKPGAPHACTSRRSLAYLVGIGVIFAGPDGLMVSAGPTQVQNLTKAILTRDQWQALNPASILGVAHDDCYYFSFDNGTDKGVYALSPGEQGFGLIRLSMHASAAYNDPLSDHLYLVLDAYQEPVDALLPPAPGDPGLPVDGHAVHQFDGDFGRRMLFRWRGKLWLLPGRTAFQQARVKAGDYSQLALRIFRDGVLLLAKPILNGAPFTLPMGQDYEAVEYELTGTSRTRTVQVVSDVAEFE
jgi:hypothetical protein